MSSTIDSQTDFRIAIKESLDSFSGGVNLFASSKKLLNQLGYESPKVNRLNSNNLEEFLDSFRLDSDAINTEKAFSKDWKKAELIFQFGESEAKRMHSLFDTDAVNTQQFQSFLFVALELKEQNYKRADLVSITRELNKPFFMPVILLFYYGGKLTLSVIERRVNKRDEQKDVLEKVTLIKDINLNQIHRAHIEILFDLSFDELNKKQGFTNFLELYDAWKKTLDTKTLNKKFFNELSNWYHWAQDYAKFPKQKDLAEDKNSQLNLIRLITRLIFVWFLKEKGLVQDELFQQNFIKKIVKRFDADGETSANYYKAILQNLFFATLNQQMGKRDFVNDTVGYHKNDHGIKNQYRYADLFSIDKAAIQKLFGDIPFLNGGLFDCLDRDNEETGKHEYIDGFSREAKHQAKISDILFFGSSQKIDLSAAYGYKRKPDDCRGILQIFHDYKFTVEENTPVEEEVALDPELLGRAFENLLAYYNPETQTTARKQTGSFYTPREVVDYMVDESLIAYLKTQLLTVSTAYIEFGKSQTDLFGNTGVKGQLALTKNLTTDGWQGSEQQLEDALRQLVHYNNESHSFTEEQISRLLFAIDNCKILDPACGSGAFPMGILNKLVYLLRKLDPEDAEGNTHWRNLQKKKAEKAFGEALNKKDDTERRRKIEEIDETFRNNASDFGRKLYLIENCVYGVDIQPIAVQISKLRFFISLIVDQKDRPDADNRGIRPLPNLETKFVAANTLIGLEKPKGFNFRSSTVLALEKELKDTRHKHFEARLRKDKQAYQKQDKEIRRNIGEEIKNEFALNQLALQKQIAPLEQQLELAATARIREVDKAKHEKAKKDLQLKIAKLKEGLMDRKLVDTTADKIAAFDIYDQNKAATWFETEWMFGQDLAEGFQLVIANPPYVQIQKLSAEEKADFERQQYKTYAKTGDIYQLFYEKGSGLLKDGGHLCYITSNKWMRTDYGEVTRKFFSEGLLTKALIDFGMAQMFESATTYTNILLLEKKKASRAIPMCRIKDDYKLSTPLISYVKQNMIQVDNPGEKSWITYDKNEYELIKRIETQGIPLKDWDIKINYGLKTGFNEAFIIDTDTRDKLVTEDQKSDEIIKPILRGEDVKAYSPQWAGKWLIYIPWHFPLHNDPNVSGASAKAEKLFARDFPAVYNYLKLYKKELSNRNKAETGIRYEWYCLQRWGANYHEDFLKPKIIYPNMTKFMPFVYDKGSFFCNQKCFIITGNQLGYLTAFFNSKLFRFAFKNYFPELLGDTRELSKVFFETVTVKAVNDSDNEIFINWVEQIQQLKKGGKETEYLEMDIENKIAGLYSLSKDDRQLIYESAGDY